MGRVIRISAVLMGVLLVAMAGGLKWARGEERADILVLLEDDYLANRLYWLDPSDPRMSPLAVGVEKMMIVGTSSNGEWLYYIGGRERDFDGESWMGWMTRVGALYRVRIGEPPELIVPTIDAFKLIKSPSPKWIIYPQEHEASNGSTVIQMIRLDLDTLRQQVLTTIETLKDVSVSQSYLSQDGQWVMFSLQCWDWTCQDYYRLSMDGARLEQIPDTTDRFEGIDAQLTWVSQDGYRVPYWQDADGQLRPVTTDWTAIGFSQMEVYQWLADEQILIVRLDGGTYWAVHPDDPNPIWMINLADEFHVYPHEGWILYRNWDDFSLWRMRFDGSELIQILAGATWDWSFDLSGKWLVYQTIVGEWRRVSIDGTHDESIYMSVNNTTYWGEWPQDQWFILIEGDTWLNGLKVLRVSHDRKVIQTLTPNMLNLGSGFSIAWMTAPVTRWNYLRLTLLGSTCIGLPIVWRGVRRYFKKTPLHQTT